MCQRILKIVGLCRVKLQETILHEKSEIVVY